MFSTYLGTETNTRKCPLPCDTMDRLAKEAVEQNSPQEYAGSTSLPVNEHKTKYILCCSSSIAVWVRADKGNMHIDSLLQQ